MLDGSPAGGPPEGHLQAAQHLSDELYKLRRGCQYCVACPIRA
jgi:hypothetical protein